MAEFTSKTELARFIKTHPDTVVFAHLAARLIENRDFERAVDICGVGLRKHPDYGFGHYILGLALYELKNYHDAKHEMEIAVAYDPAIPEAWRVLADVNENLNLSVMTQDSYLKYYLADPFNQEAADKYFQEDLITMMSSRKEFLADEEEPETAELAPEVNDEEVDNLIDTVVMPEEEEDIEKTLDEVFKDTINSAEAEDSAEAGFSSGEETAGSAAKEGEPEKPESPSKKDELEGDEFTSAMDSFFMDYENKESTVEFDEESLPPENPLEEEEIVAEEPETEEIDFPDEFVDDEPMDFSAVVSDLISEREDGGHPDEKKSEQKEDETSPEAEKEILKEENEDQSARKAILEETVTEKPTTSDADAAMQDVKEPDEEELQEVPPSKPGKGDTTHFGRPPILSPTLGEIYIAQGRFEEAIDVFRQLLDKDPENSRYRRKIEDLQVIVDKQKSGSED